MTNSCGFTPSEAYFSKEVYSKELKTYKVVERNMIAFNPSRINVGSVALQDKADEVIVSPLYVVFSVDERRLLPEYVVRFLKSKPGLRQIAARSIGTVRNNLKYDALCRMEMNLPSLEDQQTQLAALSLVEKQISAQKAMISHLQSLAKSRFVEMFGSKDFDHKPLIECVISIDSGKSPNCTSSPRANRDPAVLKLSAVSSGIYREGENKGLLPGETIVGSKEVVRGDILLARKNTPELVGRSVYVSRTEGNIMFPDIVFRMHPRPVVNGIYLAHVLSGPMFGEVKSLAHGSAKSMSNIPKSKLANLQIPLPPLPLQREFAAFAGRAAKLEFVALVQYNNQCRFQFNEGRSHDNRRDKEQSR